ncbi:unannotated protein [freshwater metagenome]|uniref:Unannotated protein n=1 Tax=freshwater metagenome TaxID=449393 RepID=A0A6J7QKD3_9ZZZZ
MTFSPGDRIRYECEGDDGLPLVRYGFIGGIAGSAGPVVVMLDGELSGDVVHESQLQPVTVTTVELLLHGTDLIDEPELRRGLVSLWSAEADTAGLDVDALNLYGDGECDSPGGWCLAELIAGGERYVLRAVQLPHESEMVRIRAEHV